jgi:hypothetical protein
MVISKYKNFFLQNIFELILFIFFTLYFFLWIKFNYSTINLNNRSLDIGIEIHNYIPYLSFYLDNIFSSKTVNLFLGYCLLPSLFSVIIFKIYKKILSNNLWAVSLTLLALTASENFPFINFLVNLFNWSNLSLYANSYENFEIMGFPIPSFSIFLFCLIFYLSLNIIHFNKVRIFFITFLWALMVHVHPIDGLIGNVFWISLLSVLFIQKRIELSGKNILFLFLIYLINLFLIFTQLNFMSLKIDMVQTISLYHVFFYFLLPLFLIIICILFLKIDFYEFYQKFLNIYILMFIEIILVIASLSGFGIEIEMIETRIAMFFLHFLYYVPIIYYLSRDEIFYINTINKKSYTGKIVIFFYYIFNKYKYIYLLTFNLLIFFYFISSLKI